MTSDNKQERLIPGTTGRPGEFYLVASGLKPDEVTGKVLDVGCGRTNLAVDLAKYGVEIDLTRADPYVADKEVVKVDSNNLSSVFGEKSFDFIFNSFQWSMLNEQDSVLTLREIAKCLKEGGRAYIIPGISEEYESEGLAVIDSLIKDIGVSVSTVTPEICDPRFEENMTANNKIFLEQALNGGFKTLVILKK